MLQQAFVSSALLTALSLLLLLETITERGCAVTLRSSGGHMAGLTTLTGYCDEKFLAWPVVTSQVCIVLKKGQSLT